MQSRCKSCLNRYRQENLLRISEGERQRYLKNPERFKAAGAKRRRLNPSGVRKNIKDYKLRKSNALPKWLSQSQHEEIANTYWLAEDLKRISGETYHVDHIIPLQGKGVCGLHVPWNLQILPIDLNLKKSNKYDISGAAR